jgi:hypothetical protein
MLNTIASLKGQLSKQSKNNGQPGTLSVRQKEFWGPSAEKDVVHVLNFSPGSSGLLSLDQQAQIYELWRVKKLALTFRTATGSTQSGTVYAGVDFDSTDIPTTAQGIARLTPGFQTAVWKDGRFEIPVDRVNRQKWMLTSSGITPVDSGFSLVWLSTLDNAGEFYLDYEIEFSGPAPNTTIRGSSSRHLSKLVNLTVNDAGEVHMDDSDAFSQHVPPGNAADFRGFLGRSGWDDMEWAPGANTNDSSVSVSAIVKKISGTAASALTSVIDNARVRFTGLIAHHAYETVLRFIQTSVLRSATGAAIPISTQVLRNFFGSVRAGSVRSAYYLGGGSGGGGASNDPFDYPTVATSYVQDDDDWADEYREALPTALGLANTSSSLSGLIIKVISDENGEIDFQLNDIEWEAISGANAPGFPGVSGPILITADAHSVGLGTSFRTDYRDGQLPSWLHINSPPRQSPLMAS